MMLASVGKWLCGLALLLVLAGCGSGMDTPRKERMPPPPWGQSVRSAAPAAPDGATALPAPPSAG